MIATCLSGGVFFFVAMFQCNPVPYFWDKTIEGGTCLSADVIIGLTVLFCVAGIFSDFTFAILPGFIVYHLQLNKRAKVMLFPLLAMGCV